MHTLGLILMSLSLCGCALFQRSPSSGYANSESRYAEVAYNNLEQNVYEESYEDRNVNGLDPLSFEKRMIRIGLEKRLKGLEEKRQYQQFKSLMSDAERAEFLNINDIYSRDRWLDENGFSTPEKRHSREVASLIEKNDIAIGMNRLAVKDSWGDPDVLEIAGNVSSGNERWKFIESIATSDGFKVQERIVYFERGKVVGWQTKK